MTPEPSELNWSYEKPTFEEVKDKDIFYQDRNGVICYASGVWEGLFDGWIFDCSRWCILDLTEPDPEPKPLWGVRAEITGGGEHWGVEYKIHDKNSNILLSSRIKVFGSSREDAICNANAFVDTIEGEKNE